MVNRRQCYLVALLSLAVAVGALFYSSQVTWSLAASPLKTGQSLNTLEATISALLRNTNTAHPPPTPQLPPPSAAPETFSKGDQQASTDSTVIGRKEGLKKDDDDEDTKPHTAKTLPLPSGRPEPKKAEEHHAGMREELDKVLHSPGLTLQRLHDAPVWPLVRGKVWGDKLRDSLHPLSPCLRFAISSGMELKTTEQSRLDEIISLFQGRVLNATLRRRTNHSCSSSGQGASPSPLTAMLIDFDDQYDHGAIVPNVTNERYVMYFSKDTGMIRIHSHFALVRALATLVQLIASSAQDQLPFLALPVPFLIVDQPAYSHRGMLLDTGREFYSVDSILRLVQTLSMAKMNVLHWHLADDQSFSFASEAVPELVQSAYPDDPENLKTYTVADIKRVVEEARKWGMRVIPELDVPGHTGGWNRAQGVLANCPRFACNTASGLTMHPYSNRTYDVIEHVLKEVRSLFPDPAIHLGGDEVTEGCWMEDPTISSISRNKNDHWAHFERKLNEIVSRLDIEPIRWEESHKFFVDKVVVPKYPITYHLWQWFLQDFSWAVKEINKGSRVISSFELYMDMWCMSWDDCYGQNPLRHLESLDQKTIDDPNRVLGFEACPWEMTELNLDSENLWVRLVGVAEQMWSSSEINATSPVPYGRGKFLRLHGNRTAERIVGFCHVLSGTMNLFSEDLCSASRLGRSEPITKQTTYRRRTRQREEMICKRIATDPPIPCTSPNCRTGPT